MNEKMRDMFPLHVPGGFPILLFLLVLLLGVFCGAVFESLRVFDLSRTPRTLWPCFLKKENDFFQKASSSPFSSAEQVRAVSRAEAKEPAEKQQHPSAPAGRAHPALSTFQWSFRGYKYRVWAHQRPAQETETSADCVRRIYLIRIALSMKTL